MAVESVDAHAEPQVHPVVPVYVGAHRADLVAQDAAQWHRQGLDYRHLQAPAPGGGGHLCAYEPGTHYGHTLGGSLQFGADGQAVV